MHASDASSCAFKTECMHLKWEGCTYLLQCTAEAHAGHAGLSASRNACLSYSSSTSCHIILIDMVHNHEVHLTDLQQQAVSAQPASIMCWSIMYTCRFTCFVHAGCSLIWLLSGRRRSGCLTTGWTSATCRLCTQVSITSDFSCAKHALPVVAISCCEYLLSLCFGTVRPALAGRETLVRCS
jgi:hypothetical protein